jgi:glycosyltransferase involved in cell wall biosynthesis
MNLLHVSAGYSPFVGGAETYGQVISERFVRSGHSVRVVTTDAGEVEYYWHPAKRHLPVGLEIQNGVTVDRRPVRHLPFAPWSFYLVRKFATMVARAPVDTRPLLRRFAPLMPGVVGLNEAFDRIPGPIDLVHAINISLEWPVIAAWRFARRRSLPFVITPFVHVGEAGSRDVLINYIMPHQLEVLQDADAVIVQSDIEGDALSHYGVDKERIHRVGMGVDLQQLAGGVGERFRAKYGITGPLVTFLGVITYDKGSFHLIEALEKLWAHSVDVNVVIAGAPVEEFERFYRRLGPETRQRVIRVGVVRGQEKLDLLAATDVLALPSRIDSFGIVYLEAWAYRKPVIGARAGGVPDVIDAGRDGLLVPFGDVGALSDAIRKLVEHPDLAQTMGERGRAKVESRYTWDQIYARLQVLYQRVRSRSDASGC